MEQKTKICPYCGATINALARKCRFCGEWLSDEDRIAHGQAVASYRPVQPTNVTSSQNEVHPVNETLKEEATSNITTPSGSSSTPVTPTSPPVVPPVQNQPPVNEDKDNDKNKTLIYVIIGIVVVAFVAFLIFRGQSNSGTPNPSYDPSSEVMDTTEAVDNVVPDVEEAAPDVKEDESSSSEQEMKDEVKARVIEIYGAAFHSDNSESMYKYLSNGFRNLLVKLEEHDSNYHAGETGLIDYDIFTLCQDPSMAERFTVSDIQFKTWDKGYTVAYAEVHIVYSNGNTAKQFVALDKEGSDWYIVDMSDAEGAPLSKVINNYLANDR